jgi:hypothetical protein
MPAFAIKRGNKTGRVIPIGEQLALLRRMEINEARIRPAHRPVTASWFWEPVVLRPKMKGYFSGKGGMNDR